MEGENDINAKRPVMVRIVSPLTAVAAENEAGEALNIVLNRPKPHKQAPGSSKHESSFHCAPKTTDHGYANSTPKVPVLIWKPPTSVSTGSGSGMHTKINFTGNSDHSPAVKVKKRKFTEITSSLSPVSTREVASRKSSRVKKMENKEFALVRYESQHSDVLCAGCFEELSERSHSLIRVTHKNEVDYFHNKPQCVLEGHPDFLPSNLIGLSPVFDTNRPKSPRKKSLSNYARNGNQLTPEIVQDAATVLENVNFIHGSHKSNDTETCPVEPVSTSKSKYGPRKVLPKLVTSANADSEWTPPKKKPEDKRTQKSSSSKKSKDIKETVSSVLKTIITSISAFEHAGYGLDISNFYSSIRFSDSKTTPSKTLRQRRPRRAKKPKSQDYHLVIYSSIHSQLLCSGCHLKLNRDDDSVFIRVSYANGIEYYHPNSECVLMRHDDFEWSFVEDSIPVEDVPSGNANALVARLAQRRRDVADAFENEAAKVQHQQSYVPKRVKKSDIFVIEKFQKFTVEPVMASMTAGKYSRTDPPYKTRVIATERPAIVRMKRNSVFEGPTDNTAITHTVQSVLDNMVAAVLKNTPDLGTTYRKLSSLPHKNRPSGNVFCGSAIIEAARAVLNEIVSRVSTGYDHVGLRNARRHQPSRKVYRFDLVPQPSPAHFIPVSGAQVNTKKKPEHVGEKEMKFQFQFQTSSGDVHCTACLEGITGTFIEAVSLASSDDQIATPMSRLHVSTECIRSVFPVAFIHPDAGFHHVLCQPGCVKLGRSNIDISSAKLLCSSKKGDVLCSGCLKPLHGPRSHTHPVVWFAPSGMWDPGFFSGLFHTDVACVNAYFNSFETGSKFGFIVKKLASPTKPLLCSSCGLTLLSGLSFFHINGSSHKLSFSQIIVHDTAGCIDGKLSKCKFVDLSVGTGAHYMIVFLFELNGKRGQFLVDKPRKGAVLYCSDSTPCSSCDAVLKTGTVVTVEREPNVVNYSVLNVRHLPEDCIHSKTSTSTTCTDDSYVPTGYFVSMSTEIMLLDCYGCKRNFRNTEFVCCVAFPLFVGHIVFHPVKSCIKNIFEKWTTSCTLGQSDNLRSIRLHKECADQTKQQLTILLSNKPTLSNAFTFKLLCDNTDNGMVCEPSLEHVRKSLPSMDIFRDITFCALPNDSDSSEISFFKFCSRFKSGPTVLQLPKSADDICLNNSGVLFSKLLGQVPPSTVTPLHISRKEVLTSELHGIAVSYLNSLFNHDVDFALFSKMRIPQKNCLGCNKLIRHEHRVCICASSDSIAYCFHVQKNCIAELAYLPIPKHIVSRLRYYLPDIISFMGSELALFKNGIPQRTDDLAYTLTEPTAFVPAKFNFYTIKKDNGRPSEYPLLSLPLRKQIPSLLDNDDITSPSNSKVPGGGTKHSRRTVPTQVKRLPRPESEVSATPSAQSVGGNLAQTNPLISEANTKLKTRYDLTHLTESEARYLSSVLGDGSLGDDILRYGISGTDEKESDVQILHVGSSQSNERRALPNSPTPLPTFKKGSPYLTSKLLSSASKEIFANSSRVRMQWRGSNKTICLSQHSPPLQTLVEAPVTVSAAASSVVHNDSDSPVIEEVSPSKLDTVDDSLIFDCLKELYELPATNALFSKFALARQRQGMCAIDVLAAQYGLDLVFDFLDNRNKKGTQHSSGADSKREDRPWSVVAYLPYKNFIATQMDQKIERFKSQSRRRRGARPPSANAQNNCFPLPKAASPGYSRTTHLIGNQNAKVTAAVPRFRIIKPTSVSVSNLSVPQKTRILSEDLINPRNRTIRSNLSKDMSSTQTQPQTLIVHRITNPSQRPEPMLFNFSDGNVVNKPSVSSKARDSFSSNVDKPSSTAHKRKPTPSAINMDRLFVQGRWEDEYEYELTRISREVEFLFLRGNDAHSLCRLRKRFDNGGIILSTFKTECSVCSSMLLSFSERYRRRFLELYYRIQPITLPDLCRNTVECIRQHYTRPEIIIAVLNHHDFVVTLCHNCGVKNRIVVLLRLLNYLPVREIGASNLATSYRMYRTDRLSWSHSKFQKDHGDQSVFLGTVRYSSDAWPHIPEQKVFLHLTLFDACGRWKIAHGFRMKLFDKRTACSKTCRICSNGKLMAMFIYYYSVNGCDYFRIKLRHVTYSAIVQHGFLTRPDLNPFQKFSEEKLNVHLLAMRQNVYENPECYIHANCYRSYLKLMPTVDKMFEKQGLNKSKLIILADDALSAIFTQKSQSGLPLRNTFVSRHSSEIARLSRFQKDADLFTYDRCFNKPDEAVSEQFVDSDVDHKFFQRATELTLSKRLCGPFLSEDSEPDEDLNVDVSKPVPVQASVVSISEFTTTQSEAPEQNTSFSDLDQSDIFSVAESFEPNRTDVKPNEIASIDYGSDDSDVEFIGRVTRTGN